MRFQSKALEDISKQKSLSSNYYLFEEHPLEINKLQKNSYSNIAMNLVTAS